MKTLQNTNHKRQLGKPGWLLYFIILPGILAIAFSIAKGQAPCNSLTQLTFANDGSGNTLSSGNIITNQFRAAYGIDVRAFGAGSNPDVAMIFDSSNPTGGDVDLGTPNAQYGGPGIGNGGASNNQPLGNLLILSEDNSQSNPNDAAAGGELRMDFVLPTYVSSMTLVDLDNNGNKIKITYNGGQDRTINLPNLGDNSVFVANINQTNVNRIRLILCGSGGLANLAFCDEVTNPTVTIGGPDSVCFGGTATISAQINGGVAPFSYAWSNSATTQNITVGGGSYSVTITDDLGATATANHTIVAPGQAVAVGGSTSSFSGNVQVSCAGGQDGWINSGAFGGFGNYTYLWSNNATTANISNLGPGTYSVTVTDQFGCQCGGSWTLTAPSPMQLSLSKTDASCNGSATGSASVLVNGGSPPYTFNWSNNSSTASANNLPAGNFSVTVTDQNNCVQVGSIAVGQPAALSAVLVPTDANCNNTASGSINCQANGGTSPYTYLWSNNSTSASPANLVAGTYSVTITDAKGCILTQSATVGQPASGLSVNPIVSSPSCNGASNGSINAQASGGVGPYTYLWSDNSTGSTLNNVGAGNYSVTVWDLNACQMVANVTVSDPPSLTANLIPTDAACFGTPGGSIACQTTGGTAPYTYLWSNGATVASPNNLQAGTYTVNITDANGCTFSQNATVGQPASAVTATASVTHADCNGGNGSINIQANGGTGPYIYLWSNNATTASLYGVPAGTYSLVISDQNNCQFTVSANIQEPAAITALLTPTDVNCFGDSSGSISCLANGGTQPYTYLWSNGATVASPGNLPAGTYTVTITDANNCTMSQTATVSQSATALNGTPTVTNASCMGSATGGVSVQATGGVPPYTYLWSNNDTTSSLNNVPAGNYYLSIWDMNECQVIVNVTVGEPTEITALLGSNDVDCHGANSGSLDCQVSGGVGPYTYLWSNGATVASPTNLIAGTYVVTVTDANGCTFTDSVVVSQPAAALDVTATVTDVSCFGGANGSIATTITGGTPPYSLAGTGGDAAPSLNQLTAGTYGITISDANGCEMSVNATVNQPVSALQLSLDVAHPTCDQADGSIAPQISGGTAPYTITAVRQSIESGVDLEHLAAGSYTVTVTDANGCEISASAVLEPANSILIAESSILADCENNDSGEIALTVNSTGSPLSFAWSNGSTGQNATDLSSGIYMVTITDEAGSCEAVESFEIPLPLEIDPVVRRVTCPGKNDGSIELNISGGSAPYHVLWGNSVSDHALYDLGSGHYSAQIVDSFGCQLGFSDFLEEMPAPIADAGRDISLEDCESSVRLTATAPSSGETGSWSALQSDLGIEFPGYASTMVQNLNQDAGNVFVWTVDRDGCSASDTTVVRVSCSPCNPVAPELLTPNHDGANDVYLIGSMPVNSNLMIMNRWGNKVYEVKNYQNDWAGTNQQGQPLPEGTYFVLLDYLCEGAGKKTLKGFVHVER